ncbi:PREDICTED: uncharacterized protein LOC109217974 [Nicotiana attenuata]|uniref:uncharacterized protein LOC109217974 n=1 Tax=Nicotiana attenuata TaxID=49451 RepID=UPI000905037A|nr:PREDICTED: uncharacterized protein LOC109217974 [Nicotiana attenuata]
MEDFLTVEDYELWTIVNQDSLIPTKQNAQNETVPKDPYEFVAANLRMMEKNKKAKKILIFGLSPDEYDRISVCSNAKHIWDALQTAHEGTNQLVTKVLRILPASWESKVTAIHEAKELDKISLDELVGNLKTHEMGKIELRKEEPKKDKALVLKVFEDNESDYDDPDLAMFAKFKRFMKNSKNASKTETSSTSKQIDKTIYDGCYKCGKLDHMVKDCPISNKSGIGYRNLIHKFDPKYVGISDNNMCTHCGRVGHFRDTCPALIHAQFRNTFGIAKNLKKEEKPKVNPPVHTKRIKDMVRGNNQDWYLDSGCSRYMTGERKNFLSLIAFQGGSVSFGNGKKGQITGIGKVDKSLSHVIKDVYYMGKRHNNVYKISIMSLTQSEHTCLSVVNDDPLLWHRRLGHVSLSQLNKLAARDLVLGLPKVEFTSNTDEDYDIGFTCDGDKKESDEDESENHKEIDSDHEEQEEERTTLIADQTNEATPTEPALLGHSSGESSLVYRSDHGSIKAHILLRISSLIQMQGCKPGLP